MRYQRELALIEGKLEASEPGLASMYAMFNQLTEGERPARTEPAGSPAWRRRLGMAAAVAVALAVLAGLALGAMLSSAQQSCGARSAASRGTRSAGARDAGYPPAASDPPAGSSTACPNVSWKDR